MKKYINLILIFSIAIVLGKICFQFFISNPRHEQNEKLVKIETPKNFRSLASNVPALEIQTPLKKTEEEMKAEKPLRKWQKKAIAKLQTIIKNADIKMVPEKVVKINKDGKPYTFQQVIVQIQKPGYSTSSYRALVDSKTGAIVKTWDRPIYEDFNGQGDTKLVWKGSN
ncbi:MAG: hypothetical protein JNM93_13385 [Bacteriovoracaceae bacterium]|nr:hypothetical protein [Bacteriovoracaceae bacterium]